MKMEHTGPVVAVIRKGKGKVNFVDNSVEVPELDDITDEIPVKTKPGRKAKKVKEVKDQDGAEMAATNPNWYQLYVTLAQASENLMLALVTRTDIPEDAKHILRGCICLRDTGDLFFAEGKRLTPATAKFWSDELKKWSVA